MSTAPWQERAADNVLDGALDVIVRLYAEHPEYEPVLLDSSTPGTLVFDEQASPFVMLSGTEVAATPDALRALDETAQVRIRIDAGYVYPGRVEDVHTIARLLLAEAVTSRPDGMIGITAYSDEDLLADDVWEVPGPWTPSTTFSTAYRGLISAAAGYAAAQAAVISSDIALSTFVPAGETLVVRHGDNLRQLMRDIAERVGGLAWHDGNGTWHAMGDSLDPTPVAAITPGTRGLLRSSEQKRDRSTWGNSQIVVYRWTDDAGNDREVIGRAEILTGRQGVLTIGRKLRRTIVRDWAVSQAGADRAAAQILARAITRRRVIAAESARALWWIRPRDAVTIATPDDAAQVLVASRVTFGLNDKTMQIVARTPEE